MSSNYKLQNQELLKHLPNKLSVYNAEISNIDLAMNIIANHKSSKFIIYSNSKSVLSAQQKNVFINSSHHKIPWQNEHSFQI